MTDRKMWYTTCGALMCCVPIKDVTQELDSNAQVFYGPGYFIAESMQRTAAKVICEALGGMFLDEPMTFAEWEEVDADH